MSGHIERDDDGAWKLVDQTEPAKPVLQSKIRSYAGPATSTTIGGFRAARYRKRRAIREARAEAKRIVVFAQKRRAPKRVPRAFARAAVFWGGFANNPHPIRRSPRFRQQWAQPANGQPQPRRTERQYSGVDEVFGVGLVKQPARHRSGFRSLRCLPRGSASGRAARATS
jgi:hypothetical protein